MSENCYDNISAQFMSKDTVQTEHRILVIYFMKNAQGTISLNIERAEKLCNDLAIAIIQAKEHVNKTDPEVQKYFPPTQEQIDEFKARNANQG